MKRSKKILIVCHCLLNSNAKITPLAAEGGVYVDALRPYVENGVGLVQLPCPETCALGMKRWGMTREQYDTPGFREHCSRILYPSMLQIQAFAEAGYTLLGVAGTDGSPNCGIEKTCSGYCGGNVTVESATEQCANAHSIDGMGVFMTILQDELKAAGLDLPFISLTAE